MRPRVDLKEAIKGVVALEFLLVSPLVIGLVYAAATYGVLFSWQMRMQVSVDRAAAAATTLDRNTTSDPGVMAASLANGALANNVPTFMGSVPADACVTVGAEVVCDLSIALTDGGCSEASGVATGPDQLGIFGGFPPLPDCLSVTSRVTI
jgi:hypothetical protein